MSRPDDAARVQHMLQAARNAVRLAQGRTREDLDSDITLGLSLWKLLEIIGEAAGRVTPGLRSANPHIPWQFAADTRNRLTHAQQARGYSPRRRTLRFPRGEFIRSWGAGPHDPLLRHNPGRGEQVV